MDFEEYLKELRKCSMDNKDLDSLNEIIYEKYVNYPPNVRKTIYCYFKKNTFDDIEMPTNLAFFNAAAVIVAMIVSTLMSLYSVFSTPAMTQYYALLAEHPEYEEYLMESISLSGEYMQNIVPVMIMIIIIGAIAFGLDIVFVNNHNKAQQRMRLLSSIIMCCEKERKSNKRKNNR